MNDSMNPDFFSKLWKCPIRRCWRYGRKFLFVVTSGIFMWLSLDFFAIVIMNPKNYPPFESLVLHAFLTTILSLMLTLTTYQFYLRLISRFRLIRAFLPSRRPPHDR